jgi:hypothetical protein
MIQKISSLPHYRNHRLAFAVVAVDDIDGHVCAVLVDWHLSIDEIQCLISLTIGVRDNTNMDLFQEIDSLIRTYDLD